MSVIQTWFSQDLQKAVKVNHLDGNLFSHNGNGNLIGVRVYNDGEPVTLTGTVSGYVITSDGSTVPCVGARSGNEATITIPPAAYQPGNAFITIFLTDGSTVTTLCAAQTTVLQARTGSQVSPGSVVQDWTQTINAAMQSVEDAAENLGGIIATPYASLTYPVPLGKYTYYNNNLYRCISPIDASEEFTAAHWTQVKLGDDVSELKSAIIDIGNSLYDSDLLVSLPITNIGHFTISTDGSMNVNANYDTYLVDTRFIKTFTLLGSVIKVAGYYDKVPQAGTKSIDNTRHLDLPQGITTVPDGCSYLVLCVLTSESSYMIAFTGQTSIGSSLSVLKTDDELLKKMTIEGFSRDNGDTIGITVDGYYIDVFGREISLATSSYCYAPVSEGKTYVINGVAGTGNRLYVCKDSNGNVIDAYQSESPTVYTNYLYTAPQGASVLYVNTIKSILSIASIFELSFDFIKRSENAMVQHIANNEYRINCGNFVYGIDLNGSNNGLFTFKTLYYSGTDFKPVSDDIAPVYLIGNGAPMGIVGANHGYPYVYSCTIASHGLNETDIGKTYTDTNLNEWILLKIIDANTIQIGCYDPNVFFKLKRTAVPSVVDFTGRELTITASALSQFYKSVKNGYVSIIENTDEICRIIETYDIIDIGVGVDALKINVGQNDNNSLTNLSDSAVTIRNLFEFHKNGSVTVYQNLKLLKSTIGVQFYYGVQSMGFAGNHFSVPQTSYKNITQTGTAQDDFNKESWDSENVPPNMFCQFNGNVDSMQSCMITGFLDATNRLNLLSNSAGYSNTTGKMYPYAIQPMRLFEEGKTFTYVGYKIPIHLVDRSLPLFSYTKVYDDYYLFVITLVQSNCAVELPEILWGKRAEIVMSDGVETETANIIDSIDIKSNGVGYLLMKLSN